MMFPKPTGRGLGQKRARKKPRHGRLKGKALEKLRTECFERDRYLCCECGKRVYWTTGHMAHIKAKRMYGDYLYNVRTLCAGCHLIEHSYGKSGVKPCPPKEI
jgi:5-methylcytosine-specific restriction endonuclease McrA